MFDVKAYNKNYWKQLKSDPERYAKYLEKNRIYQQIRYQTSLKYRQYRKEKTLEYYANNKEKHHEYGKKWRLANIERVREIARKSMRKYYARKQEAPIPKSERPFASDTKAKSFYSGLNVFLLLNAMPKPIPEHLIKKEKNDTI